MEFFLSGIIIEWLLQISIYFFMNDFASAKFRKPEILRNDLPGSKHE